MLKLDNNEDVLFPYGAVLADISSNGMHAAFCSRNAKLTVVDLPDNHSIEEGHAAPGASSCSARTENIWRMTWAAVLLSLMSAPDKKGCLTVVKTTAVSGSAPKMFFLRLSVRLGFRFIRVQGSTRSHALTIRFRPWMII